MPKLIAVERMRLVTSSVTNRLKGINPLFIQIQMGHFSAQLFTFEKVSHCVSGSTNRRDRIFELNVSAGEFLAPIFKFVSLMRIDSVGCERTSLASFGRHSFSP